MNTARVVVVFALPTRFALPLCLAVMLCFALACTTGSSSRDDSELGSAGGPSNTPVELGGGGAPVPEEATVTEAPTVTEEPTVIDEPASTTDEPVSTTDEPVSTTDEPASTTDEPSAPIETSEAGPRDLRVLVFSRTVEYRHASIPAGIAAFERLAGERSWALTTTEDPAQFADGSLAAFDVVVFLMTTGDVLDAEQEAAFERFIRSGKGFVGVHSASDTEYDWPWYGELVGAYFDAHGAVQTASVHVEEPSHPSAQGLPSPWVRRDEWYGFRTNPREHVHVVLNLDESSFDPGPGRMGEDHPIAWYREFDGGRSFYTALGHTTESYSEPEFTNHLAGAVEWAGRVD